MSPYVRPLICLAVLGIAALAGCGRKGPLDPPPAAVTGDQVAPTAGKSAAIGPDGKPIAPSNPNKRFILDGILN